MTTENAKRMMDAFYLGKRIFDRQPELPKGVTSSYIHVLDAIVQLERKGIDVRVSDISDKLSISRPGITRTIKQMESQGYILKTPDTADGRVVHITLTEQGRGLHEHFVDEYFRKVTGLLEGIQDAEIEEMCRIVSRIGSCYSLGM